MSVVLAGIDEAGYGPTLGPLCVGMAVFHVDGWSPGQAAPDLWRLLELAVCQAPRDPRARIAIADSKELKLPNDAIERKTPVHPLTHLEPGVLAMLAQRDGDDAAMPADDLSLLGRLGVTLPKPRWYAGEPTPLPLAGTAGQHAIAASRLAAAMESAGVRLVDLRVLVLDAPEFNQIVERTGSKAEATAFAWGEHARRLVAAWRSRTDEPSLRLVCDQLGGRRAYGGLIARELPGVDVVELGESEERSRYAICPEPDPQRAIVQFMPEAEKSHLPVALASMSAKLVREVLMGRFNAHWGQYVPELKPTAGYATDARRWLREMEHVLSAEDRRDLVRRA